MPGCDAASWRAAVAAVLALVLALGASVCLGETLEGERAVEAGREALSSEADFPWYDAERDGIRRVEVEPPEEPAANRKSTWQAQPFQPNVRPRWNLTWLGEILEALFWLALIAIIGFLLHLLVRAYMKAENAEAATSDGGEAVRREEDLLESLPFDVTRPQSDLLGEARRHYERGAFGEAMIYLFSYQLVKLDQHNAIRLTRGKTNRQYLRELTRRPDLRGLLERTMIAFEDFFFGHHDLDRRRFEDCWFRLDEFHQRLEQGAVS
jgi:hypothetical protein